MTRDRAVLAERIDALMGLAFEVDLRNVAAEQPLDIERDWQMALSRDPLPQEAAATADE